MAFEIRDRSIVQPVATSRCRQSRRHSVRGRYLNETQRIHSADAGLNARLTKNARLGYPSGASR
jgi:hypothetical protein